MGISRPHFYEYGRHSGKQSLSEYLRISRSKLGAQAFSTTIQGPDSRPVGRNKLRTFRQFKIVYGLENYLSAIENFEHRHCGDQKQGSCANIVARLKACFQKFG